MSDSTISPALKAKGIQGARHGLADGAEVSFAKAFVTVFGTEIMAAMAAQAKKAELAARESKEAS